MLTSFLLFMFFTYARSTTTIHSSQDVENSTITAVETLASDDNGGPKSTSTTIAPLPIAAAEMPAFLKLASDTARREYMDLESNGNIRIDVKKRAQDAWAIKYKEPILSAYRKYKSDLVLAENEEKSRMDRITANLSPAARDADIKVRAICSNETLTKRESEAQINEMLDSLPKKVYYELTFATQ